MNATRRGFFGSLVGLVVGAQAAKALPLAWPSKQQQRGPSLLPAQDIAEQAAWHVRIIRNYDILEDRFPCRIDCKYARLPAVPREIATYMRAGEIINGGLPAVPRTFSSSELALSPTNFSLCPICGIVHLTSSPCSA